MIDQQLADLRAKAEAATHKQATAWVSKLYSKEVIEHIAAANPATVLAMIDEIERLREELRKAVELLKEAAPRFVSYEECMDWQDQGEDCIAKDGHWEHELRTKMDEFVERNKETK